MNGKNYDRWMWVVEKLFLKKKREYLISKSSGKILEVGIGSGINIPIYKKYNKKDIIGIDPDEEMLQVAKSRGDKYKEIDLQRMSGEKLDFPNDYFDTVIIMLSLCTVNSASDTVEELKRVLKKDGKLFFIEHIASKNKILYKLQKKIEPRWKELACGCHLTRDTVKTIESRGLKRICLRYFLLNIFVLGEYKKANFK